MAFTKNFKILLASFIILFVSIATMLGLFIAFPPKTTELTITLSEEIILEIGETRLIPYNINYSDAELYFTTENSQVASVNNLLITGNTAGTTTLHATASYNGEIKYSSCTVIVNAKPKPLYKYEIMPISNCTFEENTLIVSDNAIFKVNVYNDNDLINVADVTFTATNDLEIIQQMEYYIIIEAKDSEITFRINNVNYEFFVKIKKF